jgi:pyroglutamyl-peptidase
MKILLTGFEPFDGSSVNPSEQIIHNLTDESFFDVQLETVLLPVDATRGPQVLLDSVKTFQPEAVVCLGQASRRAVLSIERVALNLLDFRIPDNAGNQVQDRLIVPKGPAAYFTTLQVREIFERLKGAGIPAELSLSAGAYLCNQVTYLLMHSLHEQELNIPAGFIHLPALPEQVARMKESVPSMSLDTMLRGIQIVIQVVAKE